MFAVQEYIIAEKDIKMLKLDILLVNKLDVLRGRLLGSQNDFHWQLRGQNNLQPCSRKQLES